MCLSPLSWQFVAREKADQKAREAEQKEVTAQTKSDAPVGESSGFAADFAKITGQSLPSVPSLPVPSLPSVSVPSLPSVSVPSVSVPSLPSVSLPKLPF